MSDLFKEQGTRHEPLAERLRPQSIEHFYGQKVLEKSTLVQSIQKDCLSSTIFYGPPGSGKTSLARLIANYSKNRFLTLNAVLSGVKELKKILQEALQNYNYYNQRTLLFVDEIHRWNKAQQDLLLPWLEGSSLVLLGATTQNPYFELNAALLSRCQVVQLQSLQTSALQDILKRAFQHYKQSYSCSIQLTAQAEQALLVHANGDARSLLNSFENLVKTLLIESKGAAAVYTVELEDLKRTLQKPLRRSDKQGDEHYNSISAFIKAIRGSDVDAALYYLAVLLENGESTSFIWRRLLISASEDIGLAAPQALTMVQAAASAFERVGLPEGCYFFAQATIYLALAPKSNSCKAFFAAQEAARRQQYDIPPHLKDSHAGGSGDYLYPHDYPQHWVQQNYLPPELQYHSFYEAGALGFEAQLVRQWQERRLTPKSAVTSQKEQK